MHVFLRGNPIVTALWAAATATVVLALTLSLAEPMIAHGDQTFTVTQEVTAELAFNTDPNDVLMDTSLSGITQGNSFGTTTFNVTTNNASGYTVTIAFSSSTAMNSTSTYSAIPNYDPAAGGALADYNFTVGASQAFFGYTVNNETTPTDIDATFKDGGGDCDGADTGTTVGKCWFNRDNATLAETIIDAGGATVSTGATSTVVFQVGFGDDSGIETGWYVATATLTAAVKS